MPGDWQAAGQNVHLLRSSPDQPRLFDKYLYEEALVPSLPDEPKKRTRPPVPSRPKTPPFAEVISAKALNDLFFDLRSLRAWGAPGKNFALEPEVLAQINVTTFKSSGHIGLLKKEGRLDWPALLCQESFRSEREVVDRLIPEAVRQAVKRRAETSIVHELSGAVEGMQKRLAAHVADLPPGRFVPAKRFLNDLDAAVRVLQQPDACYYLTHKYAALGQTVPELIKHMDRYSLKFAPAMPGDEAAYVDLYRALAACDAVARSQAAAAQR
jgi:hypothetical protein